MVKSNSIFEHTDLKTVELFIIETLSKGKNVVIPDFGHLEVKTLGERCTVIFKSAERNASFPQMISASGEKGKKEINALNTVISAPLKEEKIVNLSQVGIFRPVKRENGEIHVSFILSSYLRKLINKEDESVGNVEVVKKETEDIKTEDIKTVEVQKTETITDKKSEAGSSDKTDTVKNNIIMPKPPSTSSSQSKQKQSKVGVGDTLVPQDDYSKKSRRKSMNGTVLLIAVFIALVVFGAFYFYGKKVTPGNEVLTLQEKELFSLPALAEKYYGHTAFWVYIYEANSDKLNSPVNIPQKVLSTLVFPDLKIEYDVDATDSMEIQRANILSDIILKRIKKSNK